LPNASCQLKTYGELHALSTGSSQLAADDDLATLGAALHDEAEHTIACSANRKTVEKLVPEGFALGDSRQTTVLDLGGVEGDGVLGELEALLDEGGEFSNAAALLAENFLCVGCADDDVGDGGSDADLDARVALLGELTLEELVQFGIEDAVRSVEVSYLHELLVHARIIPQPNLQFISIHHPNRFVFPPPAFPLFVLFVG
jgi:hypothetical protein